MRRVVFAIALAGLVMAAPLRAADVSVGARVEGLAPPTLSDTIVIFRVLAAPGSLVTIRRQGTILVTVTADRTARLDVTLNNQPTGILSYSIEAEDILKRRGHEETFLLAISPGTTTTVSGVFLGPTLAADKKEIALSDSVTLVGATAPLSEISAFVLRTDSLPAQPPTQNQAFPIPPETKVFRATAREDGFWTRAISGADLGLGEFGAGARASSPSGAISAFSTPIFFKVFSAAAPAPAPAAPEDPCSGKAPADINCDDLVNLVDFSILLFFWRQSRPDNPRADINQDGSVNLTDFSILLFNWSR